MDQKRPNPSCSDANHISDLVVEESDADKEGEPVNLSTNWIKEFAKGRRWSWRRDDNRSSDSCQARDYRGDLIIYRTPRLVLQTFFDSFAEFLAN